MSDAKSDLSAEVFLERFPCLDDRARRVFTEVIQRLQLQCYVLRGGALKVDPRYAFIERHEELVNAYLTLGGWRLHLDRERGVARLFHPESSGRVRFSKNDTTLILALRLLYHEQKLIVSESLEAHVTVGTLRERLASLLPASAMRPFLSRKLMGTTLRRLERYSVLAFLGSSYQVADDSRIRLEPVLEHLVTSQSLEETENRLRALHLGGSEGPAEPTLPEVEGTCDESVTEGEDLDLELDSEPRRETRP